MKNCKLNADKKKYVIILKKNSFHFFYSLVEFQILDYFCY